MCAGGSCIQAVNLTVQLDDASTLGDAQDRLLDLRITNNGTTALPLSGLTSSILVHEEATDGTTVDATCNTPVQRLLRSDVHVQGCASTTEHQLARSSRQRRQVDGADYYYQVTFSSAAGTLAAGANIARSELRFTKNDYSTLHPDERLLVQRLDDVHGDHEGHGYITTTTGPCSSTAPSRCSEPPRKPARSGPPRSEASPSEARRSERTLDQRRGAGRVSLRRELAGRSDRSRPRIPSRERWRETLAPPEVPSGALAKARSRAQDFAISMVTRFGAKARSACRLRDCHCAPGSLRKRMR